VRALKSLTNFAQRSVDKWQSEAAYSQAFSKMLQIFSARAASCRAYKTYDAARRGGNFTKHYEIVMVIWASVQVCGWPASGKT
jgi:hypothetical protein